MNIQEQLLQAGTALGMCEKFQKEWGNPDIKELCDKYFRGQDFCIEHNYPSLEWLNANLRGKTMMYGILINEIASAISGEETKDYALLGRSELLLDAYHSCDITVRHDSVLKLRLMPGSFVYVTLLDNATLYISEKADGARLCVSHYGGTVINEHLIDRYHKKGK